MHYTDVVSFPPVHQDLAFAVAEEVSAAELVAAAREAAGEELRKGARGPIEDDAVVRELARRIAEAAERARARMDRRALRGK